MGRLFNILIFLCLFLGGYTYSTASHALNCDRIEIDYGVDVEVIQLKVGDVILQVNLVHQQAVINNGAHYTIIADDGSLVVQESVNTLNASFDLPKGEYRIIVYTSTFFSILEITN